MSQLIAKLVKIEQYDAASNTLVWNDPTPKRWSRIYGKLTIGNRGFFVGQGKVYSGILQSIQQNQSLSFGQVDVFDLTADDFLSLNATHPEQNAAVKAHFNPMLSETSINYDVFKIDAENENDIRFWLVKDSKLDFSKYSNNDRIATVDENLVFKRFGIVCDGRLDKLQGNKELFNVKGRTIDYAIKLFETIKSSTAKKSNNAELLKRIKKHLVTNDNFEFNSFVSYYNIVHNRRAYVYSKYSEEKHFYVVEVNCQTSEYEEVIRRFFYEDVWENGYGEEYANKVKSIPVGSEIAIKSNGENGEMEIKARGEVKGVVDDGTKLNVAWDDDFSSFKVKFSALYNKPIERVTNSEHIKEIFIQDEDPNEENECIEDEYSAVNAIIYGPPGTGKTYKTIDLAAHFVKGASKESIQDVLDESNPNEHKINVERFNNELNKKIFFVTFHQNYSYEEFVGGLRPVTGKADSLRFEWKPGVFLRACAAAHYIAKKKNKVYFNKLNEEEAVKMCLSFLDELKSPISGKPEYNKADRVVLVIDEINRANISRVFGELITLIEDDKRLGGNHSMVVQLPNGSSFGVPANLVILGTMNTADKSIALIDVALRRRFEFFDMYPTEERINSLGIDEAELINELNKAVLKKKNSLDFMIGHSFFMRKPCKLDYVFNYKIIPLLTEYFNNKLDDVEAVLLELKNQLDEKGFQIKGLKTNGVRTDLLRVVMKQTPVNTQNTVHQEPEPGLTPIGTNA